MIEDTSSAINFFPLPIQEKIVKLETPPQEFVARLRRLMDTDKSISPEQKGKQVIKASISQNEFVINRMGTGWKGLEPKLRGVFIGTSTENRVKLRFYLSPIDAIALVAWCVLAVVVGKSSSAAASQQSTFIVIGVSFAVIVYAIHIMAFRKEVQTLLDIVRRCDQSF
jgi:hypothetical protein